MKENIPKMDTDKERFRKMFPKLAEEMETGSCATKIDSVRVDPAIAKKEIAPKFDDYNPDIIDFLRRCDKAEQAEEIICYMENRKEISCDYANKLRKQLKQKGVRSFGSKKCDDYYLKQSGY
ncbi:MAG: DUF2095 domain-containing protein [Candidatus Bathyarchaeota archaeon]|nr:DUF2095 domain-containing protein [Candidatus Bathyarchaeota archaeon]